MLIRETIQNANEIKSVADMFISLLDLSDRVAWDEDEFLVESATNYLNWIFEEIDFQINDEV